MDLTAEQTRTDIFEQIQCRTSSEAAAALTWYQSVKIPSLGAQTPAELVAQGRGEELRTYLIPLADGDYA